MITDGNPASLRTTGVTLRAADGGKVAEFLSGVLPPSARKMDPVPKVETRAWRTERILADVRFSGDSNLLILPNQRRLK